jgi:hypothetical protein
MDDLSWPGMDAMKVRACLSYCRAWQVSADDDGSLGNCAFHSRLESIVIPSRTYFETTIIGTLAPMIGGFFELVNPTGFSAQTHTQSLEWQ